MDKTKTLEYYDVLNAIERVEKLERKRCEKYCQLNPHDADYRVIGLGYSLGILEDLRQELHDMSHRGS